MPKSKRVASRLARRNVAPSRDAIPVLLGLSWHHRKIAEERSPERTRFVRERRSVREFSDKEKKKT
jgi:hypothetical protein